MKITEITGDITQKLDEGYVAHCVSGDYTLGAGLAKFFDKEKNMRFELFKAYPIPAGKKYANVGKALLIGNVFNLVNKPTYKDKASYDVLWCCLDDMQKQCEELGIKTLIMPRIACGRDKMNWDNVREMIEVTFEEMDIEIIICDIK